MHCTLRDWLPISVRENAANNTTKGSWLHWNDIFDISDQNPFMHAASRKNSILPGRKGICFCVSLAIRGSKSKQCCHHFAKLTETGNVEIPHFYKARKVLTSTFVPQHLEPATNKSGYPWFVKPKMKIFAARVIHISLHVYGFAFSYIRNYLKKSFIENVCCYMKRITGP